MAPKWSLGGRSRKRTRISASTIAAAPAPVERGERLAIIEVAEQRRQRRLGQHGDPDDQRRDMAERIDQQPLARDLAAQGEREQRGPVGGEDALACGQRGGKQEGRGEQAGDEQQGQRLRPRRACVRRGSDSRCRAARRAPRAGRRARCAADSSALPHISAAQPAAASASASACSADGQRRASHSPQAAKMKLEILPNRVALPSLVSRIPACHAARSAAKNKAAPPIAMVSGAARDADRLLATGARSATGRAAPASPARSPPRPARRRRGGRGTARRRARDCRPAARRTPSDAPLMGCESPLSLHPCRC